MITNTKTLLLSLAAAAILIIAAIPAYKTVAGKETQQQSALSEVNRWKAEYKTLEPYQKQWEQQLASVNAVADIYSLLHVLALSKYDLTTNTEKIVITKIESLTLNSTKLGATRVCLATAGEQGLSITADRINPTLIAGIDSLAHRKDIEIRSITLTTVNDTPKAVLSLCLLLRH